MEQIDIKDISGAIQLTTLINEGCKRKFTLMKEDYIMLKFSLENPIYFKLGSYVECNFGLFEVCDLQKPVFNTDNAGYDYELQLDAHYWKWKNKIFKYTPEVAGQEASWNLTASLDVQAGIVLRNLKALGYKYKGQDFVFSIDSTVENKSQLMSYDNINILDACFEMAKKWDCECWVTENIIHFGRCESGDAVDFEIGKNVQEMSQSESQSTYATRIYAFGSTRNIPADYRPIDETVVVNGVVQRRLMLPEGTPYIDAYPDMTTEEAVEQVVVFDSIYPRRTGTITAVSSYEDTVDNEDGTETTETFYRFTDTGINFSYDYVLEGEELHVVFQSGSLNGMDFAVKFNPLEKGEKNEDGTWNVDAQLWEIVANEDYGRKLPDNVVKPKAGDTYVLYGWDSTKIAELGLVSTAEQELKTEAEKHVEKSRIDPSTYGCTMMSDVAYSEDGVHNLYSIGQKVNLINKAYFENGRQSRIIGFEFNLDLPYDSPIYTVGETAAYSRIGELEEKVESLTLKGQTYTGDGDSGVYVIRRNDSTPATDSNVYSALRSLVMFLRKDQADGTNFLLKFGKFIDSMIAGKGAGIYPDGRGQFERLEVRGSAVFKEIIYNRLNAQEGDTSYSENGVIESVALESDGTYTLKLRKRWENDFTAFQEGDIVYGIVNNLFSTGEYYASWMRVLSKNVPANSISVLSYPDSEVPGGKNYPPTELTIITRRGNAFNEDRQSYWYLSATTDKCLVWLEGVTKPVLEQNNYYMILGRLPNLDLFDNLPVNYKHSYIFARAGIFGELYRVDWQGLPVQELVDRGFWSAEVASSDNPYTNTQERADTVWHYGCKWKCLMTGTADEPQYAAAGWAMLEGNPEFTIEIGSTKGWYFDIETFSTTLYITGKLYNRDVTDHILDADVSWTRDTGNVSEDNAWAVKRAGAGKNLPLTIDDLGPNYTNMRVCTFKAQALLRDGQQFEVAENFVTF